MCSVYIVTAYRFGDHEQHSYVVGVYTDLDRAIEIAEEVPEERAGKYFAEVLKFKLDSSDQSFEIVLPISRYDGNGNIY